MFATARMSRLFWGSAEIGSVIPGECELRRLPHRVALRHARIASTSVTRIAQTNAMVLAR